MVDGRWLMVNGADAIAGHGPSTINHQPLTIEARLVGMRRSSASSCCGSAYTPIRSAG